MDDELAKELNLLYMEDIGGPRHLMEVWRDLEQTLDRGSPLPKERSPCVVPPHLVGLVRKYFGEGTPEKESTP